MHGKKRTSQEFERMMQKAFPEGPPTYTLLRVWHFTKRLLAWAIGGIIVVILSLVGLITIMVDHF